MEYNKDYTRILPRDLFNEAKCLKCFGRLLFLMIDNMAPKELRFEFLCEPFELALVEDGSLTICNISLQINEEEVLFKTTYNSKEAYPFFLYYDYREYKVFTDEGEFDEEFLNFFKDDKN